MKSLVEALLVVDPIGGTVGIYEAEPGALICGTTHPVTITPMRAPAKRIGVPVLEWANKKAADACLVQMLFRASQRRTLWEHLLDEDFGWQGPVPEEFTRALCHPASTVALAKRLGQRGLPVIRSRLLPKSRALILKDSEFLGVSPKGHRAHDRGFLILPSGVIQIHL